MLFFNFNQKLNIYLTRIFPLGGFLEKTLLICCLIIINYVFGWLSENIQVQKVQNLWFYLHWNERIFQESLLFFFFKFQISLPTVVAIVNIIIFSSVDDAPKEAFTFALISSSNKTLRPFVVHFDASDSVFVILRVQRSDKIILSLYQETHSFHSPFSNKEKIYWCQQTLTFDPSFPCPLSSLPRNLWYR
jgi:hypothetical protein